LKDSKRILIVSSEFPPQPGGIGNHAFNFASQLILNGCEVEVLTNSRTGGGSDEVLFDQEQAFKIHRVKRKSLVVTYLKRIQLLKKVSKSFTPNIIIGSGKFSLWLVGFFVQKKEIKKVAIVHGSELQRPSAIERNLVNAAIHRIHHIVAVSNFTKGLLKNSRSLEIEVIPNGFDSTQMCFNTKTSKDTRLQLITVGALSRRKGQHNVIKALPEILKKYPNVCYHMVGIPSDEERLRQLAMELKVESHIKIHGVLNQEAMAELLGNSAIFMMLSERDTFGAVEGFGIALLEANYVGIPSIGSVNCGIEDAINHGESGILVDPLDKETICKAIQAILEKEPHYRRRSKEWALKHEWSHIIKRYISYLDL
jgi:phosphatidylinositol alpha-1,6-mannosyltransferase